MQSGIQQRAVSALFGAIFLCAALLLCPSSLLASVRIPNKVICHDELPWARKSELLSKLRAITGWSDLGFNEKGELKLGTVASGGSQSARDLLNHAQAGPDIIIIEDASNRQDTVFSRVVRAHWKNHASGWHLIRKTQSRESDGDIGLCGTRRGSED